MARRFTTPNGHEKAFQQSPEGQNKQAQLLGSDAGHFSMIRFEIAAHAHFFVEHGR